MKYFLLEVDAEKNWYELDDDNYANRQIALDEFNEFHISCLEDWLAEGEISEMEIEDWKEEGWFFNLTKEEFENLWQSIIKKYEKQWKKVKKRYPIGTIVRGINSYIYPQGTIITGEDFLAVYTGDDPFYLHKEVCYKVISYDEINMWLVVV